MILDNIITSLLKRGYSLDHFEELVFVKECKDGSRVESTLYPEELFETYYDKNGEYLGAKSVSLTRKDK